MQTILLIANLAVASIGALLILRKVNTMSAATDRIAAEVAEGTEVGQSAIRLITGLAQQIRENAEDPAALNALADSLDANNAALAEAVAANTPSAPAEGDDA